MLPDFLLMLVIAYLSGSLPWSVWLSKSVTGIDPRTMPDGNPGAANAFRTAGWEVGAIVLILDFLKAFLPVLIARYLLQFPDDWLFWIALMPLLGHAFSIFLRLRGGRGLAAVFGVWAGLTLYEVPIVMGITAIIATWLIKNDEFKTLLIPVVAVIYLLLRDKPDWMLLLAMVQLLIMLAKIIPFYLAKAREKQA